jgi:hypothetical protein
MLNDYKQYKKYDGKLKRFNQINLEGGSNSNLYIDINNDDFIKKQKDINDVLILNPNNINNVNLNAQKQFFKDDLKKLFTLQQDNQYEINTDFLKNFKKNIYYDIKNNYEINNNQFNNNQINNNYKIDLLSDTSGAGDIYKLTNKQDIHKKYVLKVFKKNKFEFKNDKIHTEEQLLTKIVEITNDLSGNKSEHKSEHKSEKENNGYFNTFFTGVTKATNFIANKTINVNETITLSEFNDVHNVNGHIDVSDVCYNKFDYKNNDLKTCDYLYVYSKNSDEWNEIIQNLIIDQINDDKNIPANQRKYVQYYNYMVIKINGVYKLCILMELLDGGVDELFNTKDVFKFKPFVSDNFLIIKDFKDFNDFTNMYNVDNNIEKSQNDAREYFLLDFIRQIDNILVLLKKDNYFSHGDLKLKNIFFKINKIRMNIDTTINNPDFINVDNNTAYLKDTYDTNVVKYHLLTKNGNEWYLNIVNYYIADYDKCSIMYNKIRFLNNMNDSTHLKIGKTFNDFFQYEKNKDCYKLIDTNFQNLTQPFQGKLLDIRFNKFPYYMTFDFQSYILSLIYTIKNYNNTFLNRNNNFNIFKNKIEVILFGNCEQTNKFKVKSGHNEKFGDLLDKINNNDCNFTAVRHDLFRDNYDDDKTIINTLYDKYETFYYLNNNINYQTKNKNKKIKSLLLSDSKNIILSIPLVMNNNKLARRKIYNDIIKIIGNIKSIGSQNYLALTNYIINTQLNNDIFYNSLLPMQPNNILANEHFFVKTLTKISGNKYINYETSKYTNEKIYEMIKYMLLTQNFENIILDNNFSL